ncbi:formyltransferase family protein [Desulfocurvus sp. DL9XJH121]
MATPPELALVAADTSRSRCYAQALAAHGLLPGQCIFLPSGQDAPRPGQCKEEQPVAKAFWGEFDPNTPLTEICHAHGAQCLTAPSSDINAPEVVALLRGVKAEVFIYSGFGGVILRPETLGCGKRFLHVHGGWLPEYKGSTTNHYSLLERRFCGASAIFLSKAIDSGPILLRKKFPAPQDPLALDHVYDGLCRAEVLVLVVEAYARNREWPDSGLNNAPTQPYFIMHPVLRHALILGRGRTIQR